MIAETPSSHVSGVLTIEQLSHAQWHVIDSEDRWAFGVTNWVDAVSNALWAAMLMEVGVTSVDLAGDRQVLLRSGDAA